MTDMSWCIERRKALDECVKGRHEHAPREASAARNVTNSDPVEGIQRLELLGWRFSSAEIDNLSRVQRHYRSGLRQSTCRSKSVAGRSRAGWWSMADVGEGDGVEFSARSPGNESNLPPPLELETSAQLDDSQPRDMSATRSGIGGRRAASCVRGDPYSEPADPAARQDVTDVRHARTPRGIRLHEIYTAAHTHSPWLK